MSLIALVVLLASIVQPVSAQPPPAEIGIVVMHGKGGAPTKLVAGLEPSATHTSAPWESREEIVRWIGEVAR